jgi:hypothetical protein
LCGDNSNIVGTTPTVKRINKFARKALAVELSKVVIDGKVLLNFDECTFSATTSNGYSYFYKGRRRARSLNIRVPACYKFNSDRGKRRITLLHIQLVQQQRIHIR